MMMFNDVVVESEIGRYHHGGVCGLTVVNTGKYLYVHEY